MKQYQSAEKKIRRLQSYLDMIRAEAESIASPTDGDRVQTSGTSDRVGNGAVKSADIEMELRQMRADAFHIKLVIIHTIETMHLPEGTRDRSYKEQNYKDLLKYVYIDGMKLSELPDIMYVDYRTITRWHGHALQAITVPTCPTMS